MGENSNKASLSGALLFRWVGWGCSPPVLFTPSSPPPRLCPSPPPPSSQQPSLPPLIPPRQRGFHLPNLLSQTRKGVNRLWRWIIRAHLPEQNATPWLLIECGKKELKDNFWYLINFLSLCPCWLRYQTCYKYTILSYSLSWLSPWMTQWVSYLEINAIFLSNFLLNLTQRHTLM